ncbi:UDP pyrophosphate synthase [Clostridium sulfidigenes]|uniref:Isoprenyl transferase n=1 Tax=Clostridium sulfidigenes TaxID=318464 RepID=A0A084JBR5_9CLOT|nr:UDP pyrophosphate synthase [Clostridium sulfidigenes]
MLDIFKFKKDTIKEKIQLDMERIPAHIAIIMDGNGRWAKQRKLPRTMGHRAGMKNIKMMVEESSNLGVKYLTLYAFSTENWKRTKEEVGALMDLVVEFINKEFEELHRNNVKLNSIGDISKLPEKSKAAVEDAMYKTRNNTGLTLNIALNYGGRDEIVKGVKEIAKEVLEGKLQIDNIDDKIISDHLYTSGMPDPDIIIRPSGELRLSNYLLWQSAYSEFWFSNINWPDFTKEDLRRAISDFQKRDRRFGGV